MVQPKYHIFICTSCRANGTQKGLCCNRKSGKVLQAFMDEIEDRDLTGECMITNTGCFGICSRGPIAVVYPQGIWYGGLTPEKVERIMSEHIEGGIPVAEYQI